MQFVPACKLCQTPHSTVTALMEKRMTTAGALPPRLPAPQRNRRRGAGKCLPAGMVHGIRFFHYGKEKQNHDKNWTRCI